jgi:3-phenylpropionate/trans-cinnamate dioxygenase alpha subunit
MPPREDASKALDDGGARTPEGRMLEFAGGVAGGDLVDSVVCLDLYGHAIAGPTAASGGGLFDGSWRETPEAQEALGPVGLQVAGHPNIFPTAWISVSNQLCLRVPRSAESTEIWWFSFVDKSAPDELRALSVMAANHLFGPAGLLEQEDGENWAQSTKQTKGFRSSQIPQLVNMNLGHGKVIRDDQGPPRIWGATTEHAQLWTYAAWEQWMSGCDWDELSRRTLPPEIM